MSTYTHRPIAWIVGPTDEPTFAEQMTRIEIEGVPGGEYVVVSQCTTEYGQQQIEVEASDWPAIRAAIDAALAERRDFGEPK